MKKLLIVISKDVIPLSMIGNAIGHMMVGIALRIPKGILPHIEIFYSSQEEVYHFRNLAYSLHQHLADNSIFSDFAHTTTAGSALDHQRETLKTQEKDIHYYGACICAEENDLAPIKIPDRSFLESNQVGCDENWCIKPPITFKQDEDFADNCYENRFTIVLSKELSINDSVYILARSFLSLSQLIDKESLRLHCYKDANGSLHPGMSEYGLVVLQAKKTNTLLHLQEDIKKTDLNFYPTTNLQNDGKLASVAFFGNTITSKTLTSKNISLWNCLLD